jgi:hypothetical protein
MTPPGLAVRLPLAKRRIDRGHVPDYGHGRAVLSVSAIPYQNIVETAVFSDSYREESIIHDIRGAG